ncbi:MAG: ATP-binding cassette domain-containing protein, partial [Rhodospirillaceae bacterium]|nr:ATP-binding cassette domain-containing protein [Rhodospirillaceae bacterium]
MANGGAVLEVSGLSYEYAQGFALKDVALTIRAGEILMLLGPNGAGKTTLFSLITRLYDTRQGSVTVLGHELRRQPEQALAAMGVVFQQPTLDLDLTVMQNLLYHAALHGVPGRIARQRAAEELGRLDMAERGGEKVRRLNGGHRRRVEIARALLHRPRLLLLDEPTVGLDVPTRMAIVDHVHSLARDDGIAVLWATHLIDEIADDDKVVVLHQGTVRATGSTDEIVATAGGDDLLDAFTVRRHINWNNQQLDLKEDLAHLVQDIKRRICGIASAGL